MKYVLKLGVLYVQSVNVDSDEVSIDFTSNIRYALKCNDGDLFIYGTIIKDLLDVEILSITYDEKGGDNSDNK